jgi:hypothetical protein
MSATLPTKRRVGHPGKRNPKTARVLCRCVARGLPFRLACAVAKICQSTFCEWRNEDASFAAQIERAIAKGAEKRLKRIEDAARDDWRASAWLLEHTLPQFFAKTRLEVSGPDGVPLSGIVAICLPPKADSNPAVTVGPGLALAERTHASGN